MAFRPKILALANKITLEARTGIPNVPSDPEYRILAEVVTDEQADVALACKVRHSQTLEEISKKCGKSPEVIKKLLWELGNEGVVVIYTSPDDGIEYYTMPCWVPGIMEMMVGNKEQVEAHPEIARCFDEYTLKNMKLMTPNLPRGMGVMRVIPVQKSIELNRHAVTTDQLSKYIEGAWKLAVTACSCRRTRRIMGEGCGHLEEDMCIMLNKAADFHVKTGHGREITKEEAYEILKRAEENGLIHELSNTDGTGEVGGICNCCECSCLSLRGGRLFNTSTIMKSNYRAQVDKEKCVACGQCVENCQMNALRLGQKLCSTEPLKISSAESPDDKIWSSEHWNKKWRENRENVVETGTAPCKTNCPAHIAVQGYIKLAAMGKYQDALELIKKENPFPAICGRVCPKFCEDACTRGDIDDPIAIDDIKKFIAEQDMKAEHRFVPKMVNQTGKKFTEKIAVIGAGPAGLSCAYYLAVKGYPVTVFEKENTLGGMMTMGIPTFRLEKDVVLSEIEVLKELGVEFKTGVELGKDVSLNELRAQGYKAFYMAIGAQKSSSIGIPGEDFEGVYGGIDFLRSTLTGKSIVLGDKVAVIGGGNVSVDVARSAIRLGAKDVTLVYRRGRDELKADPEEIEDALNEGVRLHLLASPVEIIGANGKVSALKLEKMELGAPDASGRRSPVPTGEFETMDVDNVIGAIGQVIDWGGIDKGAMQLDKKGCVKVDELSYQTGEPDVFAGGDVVTGPSFVIHAIAAGKEGAISIHRYVHPGQTQNLGRDRRKFTSLDKTKAALALGGYDSTPRQRAANADASKAKKTMDDLRGTFTEEQMKKETERCLGCGAVVLDEMRCVGCGICTTKCKFDAIKLVWVDEFVSPRVEKLAPHLVAGMAKRGGKIAIKALKDAVDKL
jgi:NADPH-dependent glutamate synthase beta subunit-like oxidoreductase/NAD-dependent dihydropyrimidine dehydrogenase PreA subunit